jgi:large subunit ribosomal protein L15
LFQRLPKLGGFKSLQTKGEVLNLDDLRRHFSQGAMVNPKLLINKGLVRPGRQIKILSSGTIDRALHIKGCKISASAKGKIIAAGGTVEP